MQLRICNVMSFASMLEVSLVKLLGSDNALHSNLPHARLSL